jgi:diguanylate cyclase
MARVDPLTASLNRHAFCSMAEGYRATGEASGCVAVVDMDALKPINDSLGHTSGDAAIRAVARAIRQVVRADDLVFRWGGRRVPGRALRGVGGGGASQARRAQRDARRRARIPARESPWR